jgi:riboflavin-specific deaminase-like protein
VVSRSGSVDPRAEIFSWERRRPAGVPARRRRSQGPSPIIVFTTARAGERRLKKLRALADEVKVCGAKEIDFVQTLRWLREKWNVKRLLCEGGGELNDALFRAGVVDELHLTICPIIFGGHTAPTIADGAGVTKLVDAAMLKLRSMRRVGDELFTVWTR